jgi:hypothetical protein
MQRFIDSLNPVSSRALPFLPLDAARFGGSAAKEQKY